MIRSLKYRIALTVFLLEAVMVAVVLWRYQQVSINAIREQMDATDLVVLGMLEELSRYAIIDAGYDELQPYVEKIRADPHILRVLVADYRNRVVVSTDYSLLGQPLPQLDEGPQRYWRTSELTNASGRVGTLAIEFSSSGLVRAWHEARMQGLTIAGTSMLIIAVVGVGIGFLLTRRLGILDTATRRFARGNLDARVSLKGSDELAALAATFNAMADEISSSMNALRQKEDYIRSLMGNIPGAVYRCELAPSRRMELISEGVEGITGRRAEDFVGGKLDFGEIVHPEDLAGLIEAVKQGIRTGNAFEHEYRIIHADGTVRWVYEKGRAVREATGTPRCLDGVIFDITARRGIEDQKEKLEDRLRQAQKIEAIGALAGGIAHDFNNILAAILGYADMAKDDLPKSSRASNYIDQVIKAGNRAKELVKQILTFSRKGEETPQPLKPSPIIKEALKLMRASLPTTIEIREEIDPDCGFILASPTNVHQVVVNLCTNALHAMEKEKGALTVKLNRVELQKNGASNEIEVSGRTFVRLVVQDTGCGMDKATVERIFEPYFTTKEVGKGTGMGLALVHGIVHGCGGFITVESEPGKGSSFYVFFPAIEEKAAEVREIESELLPTGTERILAVDDEEVIADIYKATLGWLGYRVTAQNRSEEALATFRASPDSFDLIITDQTMPRLPGSELAREILRIRPDIPIILCTGYSSMISEKLATEIGIKRFIMKPVKRKDLAMTVREVLDLGKTRTV